MKKTALCTLLFCVLGFSMLQANTYQTDSLKSIKPTYLSNEQYLAYTKANPFELVLVAEINNYPSPQKALQYAQQLNLNAAQKSQITQILNEMARKAKEMGSFILAQESKLNTLFKEQKINDGSLIFYTNKIGALQGELRNAYLKAHIATKKVLSATQLQKYKQLVVVN
ncbi:hypothetical protein [Pedobacter glucosidilyticus]|uniref:hypothetical protein n=1 Tax=Pedobacter glucosidilyticus TaxID=1122941 RepID=UPI0026E9F829|nr:hypothetical protein [Pedobacter glucosidilyticus]